MSIVIRKAEAADCQAIFELHVDSIKSLCSDYYPKNSISEWIESRNPENYKNISEFEILIVGEERREIVGFGLLHIKNRFIKSLFISPKHVGKNYGKFLLNNMEEIAKDHAIDELFLNATLNAIEFYRRMGYSGNVKSVHTLVSGVKLDCIKMSKKLI